MNQEILKYLSEQVQREITVLSDDLARGTAKDHGDYKYACGIIRGLMMANSIFEETSRRVEEYDD